MHQATPSRTLDDCVEAGAAMHAGIVCLEMELAAARALTAQLLSKRAQSPRQGMKWIKHKFISAIGIERQSVPFGLSTKISRPLPKMRLSEDL